MRWRPSWGGRTKSHGLGVRANADTPEDAAKAHSYGATGIGLCRTERMFNAADRLPKVIDMILADTTEDRVEALNRLLPIQRDDFIGIFKAMSPYPVTIRLLDPPIHEFLPFEHELVDQLKDLRTLRDTVRAGQRFLDAVKLVDPDLHDRYVEGVEKLPVPWNDLDIERIDATMEKKDRDAPAGQVPQRSKPHARSPRSTAVCYLP